ncbi:hypothetical protein ACFQL4_09900 [Halosimplex aquaticum]
MPETQRPDDVEDWSRDLLAKSRYNLLTATYDDSLAPGECETSDLIEHLEPGSVMAPDSLRDRHRVEPIVQEFVSADDEFMVAALYDSGDPLAVFQHRQVRGTRYTGSGGAYRESVSIPELEAVATDLLDHLEWHGLACLEYLRDEDTGEFVLAEINPRMWQSLSSTVAMGADFPRYYWQQATDRADEIDPSYDVGVGCHWLKGELLHALSLFRFDSPHVERPGSAETLRDIAVSTYRHPRFDYLSLDDPGPFLQDCSTLLAELPAVPDLQVWRNRPPWARAVPRLPFRRR